MESGFFVTAGAFLAELCLFALAIVFWFPSRRSQVAARFVKALILLTAVLGAAVVATSVRYVFVPPLDWGWVAVILTSVSLPVLLYVAVRARAHSIGL